MDCVDGAREFLCTAGTPSRLKDLCSNQTLPCRLICDFD